MSADKDIRVLTYTEISQLLSIENMPSLFRMAFLLMIYYFLTPADVVSLKHSDIFDEDGKKYLRYYVKAKNTFLKVPLTDNLEKLLEKQIEEYGNIDKGGPLLRDIDGSAIALYRLKEIINFYCRSIGLLNEYEECQLNDKAFTIDNVVEITKSKYQLITVLESKKFRYVFTDYAISAVMNLSSESFILQTHQAYIRLIELMDLSPKEILVLGGGVFVLPTYFRIVFPDCNVDVCEIDEEMVNTAEKYFHFNRYMNNTNVLIVDAYDFLRSTEKKYNIIFFDIPCFKQELKTSFLGKENFLLMKSLLEEDGLLILNILDYCEHDGSALTHYEYENIKSVFPSACLIGTEKHAGYKGTSQNLLIFAQNRQKAFDKEQFFKNNTDLNRGLEEIISNINNIYAG